MTVKILYDDQGIMLPNGDRWLDHNEIKINFERLTENF